MSKKITAAFLAVVSLLCIFTFCVNAYDDSAAINNVNFRFASAAHGMTLEQAERLLTTEEKNINIEWKKVYEIKTAKESNGKLYGGNEYEATIILNAVNDSYFNENINLSINGATSVNADSNEDGTITVVFRFNVYGNFYQKIFTFFHNLLYK